MAVKIDGRHKSTNVAGNIENGISYCSENDTIIRKLQLKTEALVLLSQELDQCRAQRDQFKLMAEQIQERFLHLKKQTCERRELNRPYNLEDDFRTLDLLMESREQNKCLRLQVETLRQKLGDAQGDIKVLRSSNRVSEERQENQPVPEMHQREKMLEQLENLNIKCAQLQSELQTVLDEKHELEIERDAFKCKAHRLNYELSKALNAPKPVDLDALINENRYLQERLQQLLEEKELARQSLSKYKSMLDSKRIKGSIKLGGNSAAGTVMTHKQVEQLLQQGSHIPPQKSAAALSDLRCLCTALLEALNDKTLALAHQKKANKILASRICELDSAIQSPTTKLLEGYGGADDEKCDEEHIGMNGSTPPTLNNSIQVNESQSENTDEATKERSEVSQTQILEELNSI
ncbi:coiled-coil domain-containing protein 149 [Orussus abietinus]|uniref:coiled-coil domain-containing protein 149 n=1 Tax=Orussus abietinus TaxID=222816 RepID=UPI000626A563|nr:coiled-coil domain-containing protein 149 [Orussus abietinus]